MKPNIYKGLRWVSFHGPFPTRFHFEIFVSQPGVKLVDHVATGENLHQNRFKQPLSYAQRDRVICFYRLDPP